MGEGGKVKKNQFNQVLVVRLLPLEVVLEATAFSLMSLRADEPLVATMVSTFFFFSAAELAWDWVSMAIVHSSAPHGDGITCRRSLDFLENFREQLSRRALEFGRLQIFISTSSFCCS